MSQELNDSLGTNDILWNLDDLYTGLDAPAIKTDSDWLRAEATAVQEFAGKLATLSPAEMLGLLSRLETIAVKLGKLATFAFLNFTTQVKNAKAGAFLQQIRELGRPFISSWNGTCCCSQPRIAS